MFQEFTGREYLKIDIANNFGLDKDDWDDRIRWFDENEHQLHSLLNQAEEPALFYAGLLAWEKAKEGKPSGYPISLDATSSGIQILAALCGDRKAAEICNVVDTGHRQDAYTTLYEDILRTLGTTEISREKGPNEIHLEKVGGGSDEQTESVNKLRIDRKLTKQAIMTAFYSSKAIPKRVFGEGELLDIFYQTLQDRTPGCWEINETMLAIWDPTRLEYAWILPDNFHVKIKVMGQVKDTVHFLNEPFDVIYHINRPIEGGRSLGANMTHSIDGMIVREMVRRCNYNSEHVSLLQKLIAVGVTGRNTHRDKDRLVQTLWKNYKQSGFLSARIIDYLDMDNLGLVDHKTIKKLLDSLPKKPFEVIAVHDCFRCLPNYGNDLRRQYNNLLAEIAESEMLSYIVSQMLGRPIQAGKLDPNLGKDIREANYALS